MQKWRSAAAAGARVIFVTIVIVSQNVANGAAVHGNNGGDGDAGVLSSSSISV